MKTRFIDKYFKKSEVNYQFMTNVLKLIVIFHVKWRNYYLIQLKQNNANQYLSNYLLKNMVFI